MRDSKVNESQRHVVAMGGAFGYDTPASSKFLRYIARLTGKHTPRILFLGTASGDKDYGPLWFYRQSDAIRCRRSELSLFEPVTADLRAFLLSHDAIFVGGGNTRSLLGVWREWGLNRLMHDAWEHGVVLSGASAGAICWFEQPISATSQSGTVLALNGLGIVGGSCSPHYDSDPARRPGMHRLVQHGTAHGGFGVDERAALHIRGRNEFRSLAGEPGAACYRIALKDGAVVEEKLPTTLLR